MKHRARMLACAAAILALFLFVGCQSILRLIGYTTADIDKIQDQAADEDRPGPVDVDLEIWQAITAATGLTGTLLSALLLRWLGIERKMVKAVILGVEESNPNTLHTSITANAKKLGVQKKLASRVSKLTPATATPTEGSLP